MFKAKSARILLSFSALLATSIAVAAVTETYVLDAEGASVVMNNGELFFNDNGFSYPIHHSGRGEPAFSSGAQSRGHSVRFTVDGGTSCLEMDRSELVIADNLPMDNEYIYLGLRLKLKVDQQPNPVGQEFTLIKIWQSSGKPAIFTLGLSPEETDDFHWEAVSRYGNVSSVFEREIASSAAASLPAPFDAIGANLRPGVWHSFVVRFKLNTTTSSYSNNANVKIWQNGSVIAEKNTPMGYYGVTSNPNEFQIKVGIYKDCGGDSHRDYQVEMDQIRLANSYSGANP